MTTEPRTRLKPAHRTRVIEQRGLYFDELEEDVLYLHRPGRTVTEADNVLFTTMTMNTQALHLDAAWSATQPFGQRLMNSMFTLATLVGSPSRSSPRAPSWRTWASPTCPSRIRCITATPCTRRPS